MKKLLSIFSIAFVAIALVSCEKALTDDADVPGSNENVPVKKFTFTIKGDFSAPVFSTRGYMSADGQSLTDLWLFDYINGVCVQSIHQTPTDADWGAPSISLAYGAHHIYFVAARGDSPVVDETAHTIVWGTPRDTFWKDYEVEVVSTSNGNRAVTLDRVATRLRVTIADEVPAGCASVTLTPATWYYGIDFVSGNAVSEQTKDRTVSVPSSYIGTAGEMTVSIFGLSNETEWTTDVAVTAKNGSGDVIGSATITGAPFKRNRSTDYTGRLFGSGGSIDVTVNDEWLTPYTYEF